MEGSVRISVVAVAVPLALASGSCGGGPQASSTQVPSTIEVRVSAGNPVSGALVTVYAISDGRGEVDTSVGGGGVLGSAGPTDASGRVTVTLRSYSGPVQIVASGPALFYPDPTSPPDGTGSPPTIQIPSTFTLSSYVARFGSGAPVVPVTLLTTLADHAAFAYARGLCSSHPGTTTITAALAARDPLLVTHVTNAAAAWSPGSLRSSVPAPLATTAQSLVDVAFAALFDIALNQLAKDTAVLAGYSAGPGGLTAPTLAQLLEEDLDADGRLDGLGQGGRVIHTAGSTPVNLGTDFLRRPLAVSLLTWVRSAVENRSGITDADLASAQVFKSMTEDTSDLFGSAPTEPFDPLDRTPPEVAFVVDPPHYLSSAVLSLTVSAKDASGVKAVYAQAGAVKENGNLAGGVWHIDVPLPSVGHNTVTVWAEDVAEPAPNSGLGLPAPYQLVIDAVRDPDPPTAIYDSAFASYYDERGMTVAQGPSLFAIVPAAYSASPKVALPNGGHVYKAATRLSAGGPPDAGELETTNGANVPVLRFYVPFNPSTDSPVATARFRIAVTCPLCGPVPPASGELLPSPTVVPQAVYYDLPLSTETIPALATVSGPASLAVTLDLADAAGNAASVGGFGFTFHVVGPPVVVALDDAYPTYGDLRGTHAYKVAGATPAVDTYSTLWDGAAPNFFGGAVRLVRYIVSNPSPLPVAISPDFIQSAAGSWKMVETWPRQSWTEDPINPVISNSSTAVAHYIDGFTFYQATYWAQTYTGGAPNAEGAAFPCAGGWTWGWAAHRIGDTATKYICSPVTPVGPTETAVFSTAPVSPQVFAGYQAGGGEVLAPATDATGTMLVVPGAVGSAPGILVLYLTRPVTAPRTRPLRLNALSSSNRYETYDYEIFWHTSTWTYTLRYATFNFYVYLLMRSGQYLSSASETLAGTVAVATQGLAGSTLVGEPNPAFTATYPIWPISTH